MAPSAASTRAPEVPEVAMESLYQEVQQSIASHWLFFFVAWMLVELLSMRRLASLPLVATLVVLMSRDGLGQFDEFAAKYAPRLRFDQTEGSGDRCFPESAEDYYNARASDDWDRRCNMDYESVASGSIPTYWHAAVCGYHLHIAYWSFYGYNHDCDCCSGERDAWFESLVIKIRDYTLDERLHEVRFSQKNGWYTRITGNYEILEETHPIAYVGKASHGFYHDDGGTGTCCYYQDYRNPDDVDQHMDTWLNLVELDNSSAWMTDSSTDIWNGISSPLFRNDWDLCALNGCTGSNLAVCGTSGCHKSDTDDDPF
ncbi:hypothetical protein FHG87_013331 [Trinorchestia longiramus]|nr:hypothetical protein FHG87_013331 [Trinorchestia longiramus]